MLSLCLALIAFYFLSFLLLPNLLEGVCHYLRLFLECGMVRIINWSLQIINNFVTQWDLQDYIENTNRMQIVVIWALNKNFLS